MRTLAGAALIVLGAACTDAATFSSAARRRAHADRDSASAAVQSRGEHAMGVDQYTSTHVFTPLPDGGRIELQRDQVDTSGTRQIWQHINQNAAAFRLGDFALPGFVHGREVPGTAVMAAKRAAITYAVEPLPAGAALRLKTRDRGAVQAIHEFRPTADTGARAAGAAVPREAGFAALFQAAADALIWEQHPERDRYAEATFRSFFEQALASGGALVAIDRDTGTIVRSSRYDGYDPAGASSKRFWAGVAAQQE